MWYKYRPNASRVRIGEAAEILGVHAQTVLGWAEGGLLPLVQSTPKGPGLYSLQVLLGVHDVIYPTTI